MRRSLSTVAFLLLPALAGCGSAKLFDAHPVPASDSAAEAPWPNLVDTPTAPPKGRYSAEVPDPANGIAISTQLGLAAEEAQARAEPLRAPVLTEAERRKLSRHQ